MSTPEQAPDKVDKLIGEVFANRYRIEEHLGEGAMGTVYRAKHVKVGRSFAVKILHSKLLEDTKVALRFDREAELAGRLRHRNVVGVVDVGETTNGLRYMVMDFAEGHDLATLLNEAPMKPDRIVHLTRQMLEGLYHAHEAGLIHRDFKPENVIIERDDHGAEIPRIVDFGIAILREGGDSSSATGRLTTNGLVLGTPHYMAPEQAIADPIDHRIDLFALGIVVYEMLSGKLPFDGSGAEVARANLLLDPPLISQRVPYLEVDPLLEAFARRMMAKKRDMRPATAKAAREILDLIERDRAAAAAALGVPLETGTRTPQITADVVPHRVVNEDSGNYMLPPSPRATDLEAPPVTTRRGESAINTAPAQALAWSGNASDEVRPRSRRGWIIAGLAAAVAAGAIIVVAKTHGSNDVEKKPDKVVIQATEPAPPPAPRVEPPKPEPPPVVDENPAIETPAIVKPTHKPKTTKPDKGKTIAKTETPKPVEVTRADPPKPVEVTQADPPKPADETTNAALTSLYYAVGRDIKALGDNAADIAPRYRNIVINKAYKDPALRNSALSTLAELKKIIETRKK